MINEPHDPYAEAFARGDFARVRELAQAAGHEEDERARAEQYLAKISPPSAARFALASTAALVLTLTLYFVVFAPHP